MLRLHCFKRYILFKGPKVESPATRMLNLVIFFTLFQFFVVGSQWLKNERKCLSGKDHKKGGYKRKSGPKRAKGRKHITNEELLRQNALQIAFWKTIISKLIADMALATGESMGVARL